MARGDFYLSDDLGADLVRACIGAVKQVVAANNLALTEAGFHTLLGAAGLSLILTGAQGNKELVVAWVKDALSMCEISAGPLEGN